MKISKFVVASLAAASFATASFAGGLDEAVEVEEPMIAEEEPAGTSAGSGGIILPLLALVAVAALIADDGT